MRFKSPRFAAVAAAGLLALYAHGSFAATDTELVSNCRGVMAAAEPARRVGLERDLFAYEMHAAVGASNAEMRVYHDNLADTCGRVAYNNRVLEVRNNQQMVARRQPAF